MQHQFGTHCHEPRRDAIDFLISTTRPATPNVWRCDTGGSQHLIY